MSRYEDLTEEEEQRLKLEQRISSIDVHSSIVLIECNGEVVRAFSNLSQAGLYFTDMTERELLACIAAKKQIHGRLLVDQDSHMYAVFSNTPITFEREEDPSSYYGPLEYSWKNRVAELEAKRLVAEAKRQAEEKRKAEEERRKIENFVPNPWMERKGRPRRKVKRLDTGKIYPTIREFSDAIGVRPNVVFYRIHTKEFIVNNIPFQIINPE